MFYGIPADAEVQPVRDALVRWAIPWDQLFDAKGYDAPMWALFNVEAQPSFYVFDRDGKIAAKRAGVKQLPELLEKLAQQQP